MDIAIISYNHPESSLVLAKYLTKTNNVHYFYITDIKKKSIPGIGYLSEKNFKIGLNEIKLEKDHPLYAYLNRANLKVTVIAYPTFRPQFTLINEFLTGYFLRRIKKTHFDVINLIGQQELLISFHKALSNRKTVHSLHEVAKHYEGQVLKNKLLDFLFNKQIPVIVHSNNSYEMLMEQYPFNQDKVLKVPFGLFETYKFFSTGSVIEQEETILFYGFIKSYKGLGTFIKAVKYAQEKIPGIKAIIAGGGSDRALASVENDSTFKVINRFLDNEEIVSLNEQATMVICPYTSASQSGIVTTTYVFNKPIIASNIGGFKETIIDDFNGYLVPIDDHVAIGDHIVKLCSNKTLLNTMEKNIKGSFESGEYSWQDIANKTLDFYKS